MRENRKFTIEYGGVELVYEPETPEEIKLFDEYTASLDMIAPFREFDLKDMVILLYTGGLGKHVAESFCEAAESKKSKSLTTLVASVVLAGVATAANAPEFLENLAYATSATGGLAGVVSYLRAHKAETTIRKVLGG